MDPPTAPSFILEPLGSLRSSLRQATIDCTSRGLLFSAKWAAELLISSPPSAPQPPQFNTSTPVRFPPSSLGQPRVSSIGLARGRGGARDSLGSVMEIEGDSSPGGHEDEEEEGMGWSDKREAKTEGEKLDEEEADAYLLALAYYNSHELLRTSFTLKECRGPKARWLRTYAKFLAGDKRAQEESGELLGLKDKNIPNPYVQELLEEMESWESGTVERDGYLLFLKALLILALPPLTPSPFGGMDNAHPGGSAGDSRLLALDYLVASVNLVPYNWSAWLKIGACLDGPEELDAMMQFLPQVVPAMFYYIHATLEIHAATEHLYGTLDELQAIFGDCAMIKGIRGLIHYHVREFDDATKFFADLRETDPYRVEDIDIYSNILYVSEKRAELAMLAQEYTKIDRSRPEVCCLVGNYYSLRREHEKAILYFKRALKLDRAYLSAWTLMGHEYVEIKNTNAAIASYRRAVDVNRKDYRAWYGLGQTYELLGEPFYALNYYQKATALRPYDARMWCALAICYEKLKKAPDAIQAYLRALVASEPGENDTALRIGKLYDASGDTVRAAAYYRRALMEGIKSEQPRDSLSKIWLWLAESEIKKERESEGEGDLGKAEEYLTEVLLVQEDKEKAVGLLKEVHTLTLNKT